MIIIIGLGNPGKKFENTRHNVGFAAIDEFAKENNFPEFNLEKKANALISEKDGVMLVKPQTFMNESGKTAKELLKNSNAYTGDIAIVHDDIDLEIGKIKIVKDRGSAGHKGVESVIQNIGNDGLIRFRIGIKPASGQGSVEAKKVVLKKFSADEQKITNETIQKTAAALDLFVKEGLEKTMNEFNK